MSYSGNVVEMRFSELQQLHQQQDQALAAEMVSARTELASVNQGASVLQESLLSLKQEYGQAQEKLNRMEANTLSPVDEHEKTITSS